MYCTRHRKNKQFVGENQQQRRKECKKTRYKFNVKLTPFLPDFSNVNQEDINKIVPVNVFKELMQNKKRRS